MGRSVSIETAVRELPQATVEAGAGDISHEICCIDEQKATGRISMCGLPLSDDEPDDDELSCAVCLDLIEEWVRNVDLYGEDPQAPNDVPCRCCPRRFQERRLV